MAAPAGPPARTVTTDHSRRARSLAWAGYLACAWGVLFAAVSFYWAAGGTSGLDTIGGSLARLGRARDPGVLAALWVTGVLKLVGAALALALVRPWGRRLPRRLLRNLAWVAAVGLTLYGLVLVIPEALVVGGVIGHDATTDWTALRWHLYLWDAAFVVWGVLFGLAAWGFGGRWPGRS